MSRKSSRARLAGLALAFAALIGPGHSAELPASKCPEHYFDGRPPAFANAKVIDRAVELCSIGFAVLHSPHSKGPLYAVEHLTKEALETAPARDSVFHADARLKHGERAELADYDHSGYDRGHMAPSGDMGSGQAQEESFCLCDMVPQNPHNNRFDWRLLEEKIRRQAKADGELWLVTGPLFVGDTLKAIGKSQVLVPTHLFKAVYDPAKGTAVVYVMQNAEEPDTHLFSVPDFTARYHVDPIPGLPIGVRSAQ